MSEEDRPIIVGGGPDMVTVELPGAFKDLQEGKFSITPTDVKQPFQHIVVKEGNAEVWRRPLAGDWTITIE